MYFVNSSLQNAKGKEREKMKDKVTMDEWIKLIMKFDENWILTKGSILEFLTFLCQLTGLEE
jgi:hypothetical protein